MSKLDTCAVKAELREEKIALQNELIVFVELKRQNTNTFRSVVNQRKDIQPRNP